MNLSKPRFRLLHYVAAWSVHLFTASAACIGVFTVKKYINTNMFLHYGSWQLLFLLMQWMEL